MPSELDVVSFFDGVLEVDGDWDLVLQRERFDSMTTRHLED